MSDRRNAFFILGDQTTRKTLESTYTEANHSSAIPTEGTEMIALEVEYTMGSAETANSIELEIRFANPVDHGVDLPAYDSALWYQQISEVTTGGATTVNMQEYSFTAASAAATYDRIHIDIPINSRFLQVRIKETGVASNKGSASVKLALSEMKTT